MAGIFFTDGKMVLAGFNPKKFCITGFGGKAEGDETPAKTAVREVIEELFEFEQIPEALLKIVYTILVFDRVSFNEKYSTFTMNFQDLDKILATLKMFSLKSRVYDTIPTTLTELLITRKIIPDAELSHLALIPCCYNLEFDKYFIGDIYSFKNCGSSM